MQATPDVMMGSQWYCSNNVEVTILDNCGVWVIFLLLRVDYSCHHESNVLGVESNTMVEF